jgi:putative transcriptional regulator
MRRSAWRLGLGLALVLLPAGFPNAALPKHSLKPEAATLTGQLLVASQRIGDPSFHRTVILLIRHSRKDGSFGITINRPVGEQPLAKVLDALGVKDASVAGSVMVFVGGPVEQKLGIVVHTAEYELADTIHINGEVAATTSREILDDIAHNQGPQKMLLAFGYAGWSPGQLENELARGDWFVVPSDPALVFDEPRDRVWHEAMARRPRDP